jgi:hypothetical protein
LMPCKHLMGLSAKERRIANGLELSRSMDMVLLLERQTLQKVPRVRIAFSVYGTEAVSALIWLYTLMKLCHVAGALKSCLGSRLIF